MLLCPNRQGMDGWGVVLPTVWQHVRDVYAVVRLVV